MMPVLSVNYLQSLFPISVHHVRYAGNFGALLGQGEQVVPADKFHLPVAGAGHQLLEPDFDFIRCVVKPDSAQRQVVDLRETAPELRAELEARLAQWRASLLPALEAEEVPSVDAETLEQLQNLGYVGGEDEDPR